MLVKATLLLVLLLPTYLGHTGDAFLYGTVPNGILKQRAYFDKFHLPSVSAQRDASEFQIQVLTPP